MTAANKSVQEWIASEIIETEPIRIPMINLPITRSVFEQTERIAALLLISD